jgi:hypothetical protein
MKAERYSSEGKIYYGIFYKLLMWFSPVNELMELVFGILAS